MIFRLGRLMKALDYFLATSLVAQTTVRSTLGQSDVDHILTNETQCLCQEAGLVPFVQPEVLMDGEPALGQCRQVTDEVLRTMFAQPGAQRVMLLKPNMVPPGSSYPHVADIRWPASLGSVACGPFTEPPAIARLAAGAYTTVIESA